MLAPAVVFKFNVLPIMETVIGITYNFKFIICQCGIKCNIMSKITFVKKYRHIHILFKSNSIFLGVVNNNNNFI